MSMGMFFPPWQQWALAEAKWHYSQNAQFQILGIPAEFLSLPLTVPLAFGIAIFTHTWPGAYRIDAIKAV